jgi:FMN phosphatase YigB (HAD superfamily)
MIGRERFDSVVIAHPCNGLRSKPEPDGINACLKDMGIGPHEAIHVGNSDEDTMVSMKTSIKDYIIYREEIPLDFQPKRLIYSLHDLSEPLGITGH